MSLIGTRKILITDKNFIKLIVEPDTDAFSRKMIESVVIPGITVAHQLKSCPAGDSIKAECKRVFSSIHREINT